METIICNGCQQKKLSESGFQETCEECGGTYLSNPTLDQIEEDHPLNPTELPEEINDDQHD